MNTHNKVKQQRFLTAYVGTANITRASAAAKVGQRAHYTWLDNDPAYPALFAEARLEAGGAVQDEAVRRAMEGVLETVYYKGKPCGVRRVYSDALLMALLKAFMPEKYGERSKVEVSAPLAPPILLFENAKLDALGDGELESLVVLARKIA